MNRIFNTGVLLNERDMLWLFINAIYAHFKSLTYKYLHQKLIAMTFLFATHTSTYTFTLLIHTETEWEIEMLIKYSTNYTFFHVFSTTYTCNPCSCHGPNRQPFFLNKRNDDYYYLLITPIFIRFIVVFIITQTHTHTQYTPKLAPQKLYIIYWFTITQFCGIISCDAHAHPYLYSSLHTQYLNNN